MDVTTTNEIIKYFLPRTRAGVEKVKIPHGERHVNNVVYTIQWREMDWVKDTNDRLDFTPTVKGVYRLALISDEQFNITIRTFIRSIDDDRAEQINTIGGVNKIATFKLLF